MFAPDAFQPEAFGELLDSGEPAFQGAAFDGGAFHMMGEPEAASAGRPSLGLKRRPYTIPAPLLDEGEEFFALV
jgi:hypothetical protein